MRPSLNDIQQIEKYLHGQLTAEDALVFEAKTIVNFSLRKNLFWQKKIYDLLKHYHRKKLKCEVERTHRALFRDPSKLSFQKNILQLFSSR